MNGILDSLFSQLEQRIKVSDGDYIKDGILYCGKCNTKKQVRIELNGKIWTPACLCKCETEKRDAEEAKRRKEEELERIKALRRTGFSDEEMQNWTFEKDDRKNEKISNVARNYVKNFPEMRANGKGLLLYGPVGTGKTFISACIANELIDQGYACMVTNFARLINTLQGMFEGKQEYIDGLNRVTLLVIDDLASERDTEYVNETVQSIIDARYRSGKPLIVTTNLTAEELKRPADIRKQRIYSRLLEMCIPVQVEGKDRRKEKLKDDYKRFEEILGL